MPLQVDLKSSLSIGQLAQAAGLRTSAIRYYEEIGLLPAPERQGSRRVYGAEALEQLKRIALAQAAGFSLQEVKLLERGLGDGEPAPQRWRRLAARKLSEVDAQIARLRRMRALLHRALHCECTSMRACPLLAQGDADTRASVRAPRRIPSRP
ncbi:MerR family transcriptional regulator [Vitiosangium sp. GDMCC 1.1324]|uniref:MerR family transcriptional regulator n=1 Tax=Vitiosangium sp. (strain GDMCC 1.1324) TaxID=2138576 RepID=UPI000D3BF1D0|nr:MerR family transcriptional regulator [Vitiosangium sp. GDMCC 1.1324]